MPERSAASGHLEHCQRHTARLGSNSSVSFGKTGALHLGLLYRCDSPRTFSLVARSAPVSSVQLARDPGYAQPPFLQPAFFGPRGSQELGESPAFGHARSPEDFVTPRELLISLGLRF